MPHDDDSEEPELECPVCCRSFHAYARLEDHMSEHEGVRHCPNCGKHLRENEYHRC